MPVVSALKRLRQEDYKLEVSLSNIVRPSPSHTKEVRLGCVGKES